MPYKYALQICPTNMSYKYVLQVCPTICPTNMSYKYVLQKCPTKNVQKICSTKYVERNMSVSIC
jgi:hypothetical protein